MTKSELCKRLAPKLGMSASNAKDVVDAVFSEIIEAVEAGEKVSLLGFATFGHKEKAERKGRNPATGEDLIIPARKVPFAKISKVVTIK